jgi:hypothetical protein
LMSAGSPSGDFDFEKPSSEFRQERQPSFILLFGVWVSV